MISGKESSSNEDSYDDDERVVVNDMANTKFEIDLSTISSSPKEDASPIMHALSPTLTVDPSSSLVRDLISTPFATKRHTDVDPPENQRTLRTRGGRKSNSSSAAESVTHQVPNPSCRRKNNQNQHRATTSDRQKVVTKTIQST